MNEPAKTLKSPILRGIDTGFVFWLVIGVVFCAFGCAGGGAARKASIGSDKTGYPASTPHLVGASDAPVAGPAESDGASTDPFLDENLDFLEEEEAAVSVSVADPLEPFNRVMFQFNDKLYFYALKPVATIYRNILPLAVRKGVRNFFYNVASPVRFTNCLLQLKGKAAVAEVGRFVVNTTAGGLGFWDLSSRYPGLEVPDEDLGQTLGHYRIGNGFYLVLPLLGSSTLRDLAGFAGDLFLSPIHYVDPQEISYGLTATRIVNDTSLRIGDYEAAKEAALTPYEAFRDGYIQYRQKKLAQ